MLLSKLECLISGSDMWAAEVPKSVLLGYIRKKKKRIKASDFVQLTRASIVLIFLLFF